MKTGDYILDLTEDEHEARARQIGWKESMYTCWALDAEMVDDHPYWSELTPDQKRKYEVAYSIYWDFYSSHAPKGKK